MHTNPTRCSEDWIKAFKGSNGSRRCTPPAGVAPGQQALHPASRCCTRPAGGAPRQQALHPASRHATTRKK
eukprot:356998-Chlamydomonas_euryale.AAC.2